MTTTMTASEVTTLVGHDLRYAMALGVVAGALTGGGANAFLRTLIGRDEAGRLVRAVHDLAPTSDVAEALDRLAALREMAGETVAAAQLFALAKNVRAVLAGEPPTVTPPTRDPAQVWDDLADSQWRAGNYALAQRLRSAGWAIRGALADGLVTPAQAADHLHEATVMVSREWYDRAVDALAAQGAKTVAR